MDQGSDELYPDDHDKYSDHDTVFHEEITTLESTTVFTSTTFAAVGAITLVEEILVASWVMDERI